MYRAVILLVFVIGIKPQFAQQSLDKYKDYEFMPGENILFEDNIGSSTTSNWEVLGGDVIQETSETEPAIRINKYYTVLSPRMEKAPTGAEFFTIEFDAYLDSKYEGNPGVFINFLSGDEPTATLGTLAKYTQFDFGSSKNRIENPLQINNSAYYDKWHHYVFTYSPQYQGSVIIYVDQFKVIDLKECLLNFERITVNGNSSDEMIMKFRNFRITDSGPANLQQSLMSSGKFVSHGILFNPDNTLKPESMGTLRQISRALNESPDLKLEIEIYSDNTVNNAEINNTRRAEIVKAALVQMGINENRLIAPGNGEGFPVNNNLTNTEKANYRRVEFKTFK